MTPTASNTDQVFGRAQGDSRSSHQAAWAVFTMVCAAGVISIVAAALGPWTEWRLLAMPVLAFILSPVRLDIRCNAAAEPIRFPLLHPVLFASSIVLAPVGAAFAGAFGGASRLYADTRGESPLYQALYAVFKLALACAGASAAFALTGGDPLRPQGVGAFLPLVCAGLVYVALNALLVGLVEELSKRKPEVMSRNRVLLFAEWSLCLLAGYPLAVLYAFAPPYVLLVPALPVVLARMVRLVETPGETGSRSESGGPEEVSSPVEQSEFIDPVTGLASKRYLEMYILREIGRSDRSSRPFTIAVFDVDGFNALVARVGGKAAAEAVSKMGSVLKSGVRDYDLVSGYSDGRLLVVLPETSVEASVEIVERLHASLVVVSVKREKLSITVGVATYPTHGSSLDELVNAAHRAINRGKLTAPNSVHVYTDIAKAG